MHSSRWEEEMEYMSDDYKATPMASSKWVHHLYFSLRLTPTNYLQSGWQLKGHEWHMQYKCLVALQCPI